MFLALIHWAKCVCGTQMFNMTNSYFTQQILAGLVADEKVDHRYGKATLLCWMVTLESVIRDRLQFL